MVEIDESWEHLKTIRTAGYVVPPEHPDLVPANETVILWELYSESPRMPEVADHGQDMIDLFAKAESEGKQAEELLRKFAGNPAAATKAGLDQVFDAMAASCSACHKRFRNPAGIKSRN
jgi:hypothetical protein